MKIKMESREAVVIVPEFRIEATVYLHPASRFSDFLNAQNREFLPMTKAHIYSRKTQDLLGTLEFAVVNRKEILLMYPKEMAADVKYENI